MKVLAEGKLEERQVRTGLSNDRWTEVVEGLKEGEQVVVRTQESDYLSLIFAIPTVSIYS